MESQYKASIHGGTREVESKSMEVKGKNQPIRVFGKLELILRLLAFLLTLGASILLGTDKQTKVVPIPVISTLPPLYVPVTARWHHLSAFTYFVVTNAIACSFAALSLLVSIANRGGNVISALTLIVVDVVMVALLFSGNGAATAVGYIGYKGNSQVQWKKVCNVFDKFCNQVGVSVVLSLLGAIAFVLLVVVAALGLQKKSK